MYFSKIRRYSWVLLITVMTIACKNDEKKTDYNDLKTVLAVVGEDTVFLGDYKNRVLELKQNKPDLESEATRRKILDEMVDYYLMVMDGRDKKLQEHPYVQFQVRTKEDELYYAHAIRNAIVEPSITEDQIKVRYEQLKEQLDVKHIFIGYDKTFDPSLEMAPNQKKIIRFKLAAKSIADSLLGVLKKEPDKFESFIEQFSDDAATKFFDGTIKGLRRGELPNEVGDALFKLQPDELSQSIDDGNGYHIYKIIQKSNDANVLPYEKAKIAIKEQIAKQILLKPDVQIEKNKKEFIEKRLRDGSYSFNQSNAVAWYSKFKKYDIKKPLFEQLTDDELNTILATSLTDTIKIIDIAFALSGNRFNSRITMDQMESGVRNAIAVRLVSRWAKEQKIKLTDREAHFIKRIEGGLIYNKIQPPTPDFKLIEDTSNVRRYYEVNIKNYKMPDSLDLGMIVMNEEAQIRPIADKIKSSKSFEISFDELRKKNPASAVRSGLRPLKEFGNLSARIQELKEGDISDVFIMNDGKYGIVKIYKRTQPSWYSLDKVFAQVKSDYAVSLIKQTRDKWLLSLREKYTPTVNYHSLKDAFEIKLK